MLLFAKEIQSFQSFYGFSGGLYNHKTTPHSEIKFSLYFIKDANLIESTVTMQGSNKCHIFQQVLPSP